MAKKFATVNAAALAKMNYSVNGSNASLVHSVIRNSDRTFGNVELAALIPNPFQPRKKYNQEKLRGLATSIAENGLIEPIVVRRSPTQEGKLEIVCGERRVRATRDILHWDTIHAEILESCTDSEVHRIAVLENVQREDLSPLEVAAGYQALLDERDEQNRPVYSIRTLGDKLGKNKDHIQEHVSLLTIQEDVKALLEQENPIPRRVALELADITDKEERAFLVQEYQDGQLKPKQLLAIIRDYKGYQKDSSSQESVALAVNNAVSTANTVQMGSDDFHDEEETRSDQGSEEPQIIIPNSQPKEAKVTRPKSELALLTLREKLLDQDKQFRKVVDMYNKNFSDMSLDERKLLIEFAQQWQKLFGAFVTLQ